MRNTVSEWEETAFSIGERKTLFQLPWQYADLVGQFLRPGIRVLEWGSKTGQFLLGLPHDAALCTAGALNREDYEICRKRMEARGGKAVLLLEEQLQGCADVVICRHVPVSPEAVRKVLKKGGFFVTQQMGGQQSSSMGPEITGVPFVPDPYRQLEQQIPLFDKAGFRVMQSDQVYRKMHFPSKEDYCLYAEKGPEKYPGLTGEKAAEILPEGPVMDQGHYYFLVAKAI
jgi:hypothetical protein